MSTRVMTGVGGDGCFGCPSSFGCGSGVGLWFQCKITETMLTNVCIKPDDCPYVSNCRDAGDDLMSAVNSIKDAVEMVVSELSELSLEDLMKDDEDEDGDDR